MKPTPDDSDTIPVTPIPLYVRIIFGLSLGLIPVKQLAGMEDVYASKWEIVIKFSMLIPLCIFIWSAAPLGYHFGGSTGIHAISMSAWLLLGLGFPVIFGQSLRRKVKIRTGEGLADRFRHSIRYSG